MLATGQAKQQLDTRLGVVQQVQPKGPDMSAVNQAQKLYNGPELAPFIGQYQARQIQKDELLITAYFLGKAKIGEPDQALLA